MSASSFTADLASWGPQASRGTPSLTQAQHYCRQLARTHYENFTVASWLLPSEQRQHFANVYAYCRWADDLADETPQGSEALSLLEWWESQLDAMYAGQMSHPVFVALAETIRQFDIPREPLADLLVAFRQDQTQTRYETLDELLGYCRYSANPVGRIVLRLGRAYSGENAELSDKVCTGLQLANFWQDIARDWQRGRIYLPQQLCRHFDYHEHSPHWGQTTPALQRMLALEIARAEKLLNEGRALVKRLARPLSWQVDAFVRGGLAVLEAIRRQEFDVWSRRPAVSKWKKARILVQAWCSGGPA